MAIVDQFGYPIDARLINATTRRVGARPYIPTRFESIKSAVPQGDFQQLVSISRRLWANNGIIKAATMHKALHSIGRAFDPIFMGAEREWGALAISWLSEEWYPLCNVRGSNFDFKTSLYLESIAIDRDGDCGEILTKTDTDYPQVQSIPAHRIGQRDSGETIVQSGPFKGFSIFCGVITSRQQRPIAYRFLGDTPEEDEDISERALMLSFDPEWSDGYRGFPVFSHALNDFRDADQSQYWEQLNQLASSSRTFIETNETGGFDPTDPSAALGNSATNPQGMTYQQMEGGTIQYFKAGTGSKLEQFVNMRPGDDWEVFQDRIARKALAPVWPYSLVWKPESMSGTQERSAIQQARALIVDRQALLKDKAKRRVGYAISKAINSGRLPAYPGKDKGGFLKWDFTTPPQFSIDNGRDGKQWLELHRAGAANMGEWLGATGGGTTLEHFRKRANEVADMQQAKAEVEAARGFAIDQRQMQMLTPNDQGTAPATDDGDDSDEDKLANIEEVKARADAYGVGVRAGAITPNDEDEAEFRRLLTLPQMNGAVRSAWTEDGGVRRPITIVPKDGVVGPAQGAPEE